MVPFYLHKRFYPYYNVRIIHVHVYVQCAKLIHFVSTRCMLLVCVQVFRAGEKILDRQRFQFPPTWVYVDNVEGEWGAFNEIMKRKDAAVQAQVGSLQMKIVAEDKVVEQKTTELLQEWEKGKPVLVRTFVKLFIQCTSMV